MRIFRTDAIKGNSKTLASSQTDNSSKTRSSFAAHLKTELEKITQVAPHAPVSTTLPPGLLSSHMPKEQMVYTLVEHMVKTKGHKLTETEQNNAIKEISDLLIADPVFSHQLKDAISKIA